MSNTTLARYDPYKDTGVHWITELPSRWAVFDGKRIFSNRREASRLDDDQLAVSQEYGVIPQSLMMKMNKAKVMLALKGVSSFRHVEIDDFVISLRSFEGGIEYSAYTGCVSPAYTVLVAQKPIISQYYKFLLKSGPYVKALQSTTDSLRDGKAISYSQFGSLKLPVPPLEEQKQIAAFLDYETAKIDALIEKQQQLIALLGEKRLAVISHAVTKGLNPDAPMRDSGVEWLAEVPAHWTTISVRNLIRQEVLEIQDGNHGESHPKASEFTSSGIPFLMAADMNNGKNDLETCHYISESRADALRIPPALPGDLFLSHKGNQLGEVSMVPDEMDFPYLVLTPQITYYRVDRKLISRGFLFYVLQSKGFHGQLWFLASIQATRPYVGLIAQRELRVVFPPVAEQRVIAEHLAEKLVKLDDLLVLAEGAIDLLQERRTALISAAVTGKIDVRDWKLPTSDIKHDPETEVA